MFSEALLHTTAVSFLNNLISVLHALSFLNQANTRLPHTDPYMSMSTDQFSPTTKEKQMPDFLLNLTIKT